VRESYYVTTLNSVKIYFKRPVETLTEFSKPNIYYGFNADDRKKSENQPISYIISTDSTQRKLQQDLNKSNFLFFGESEI
jgi:hypothetical protein